MTEGEIYVVRGKGGSLLSYKTASELGLIKLNIIAIEERQEAITVNQLEANFPTALENLSRVDPL